MADILTYATFGLLPVMLCGIPCMAICCGKKHHPEEQHDDEFDRVQAANRDENQQLLQDEDDSASKMTDVEDMLKLHCPKEGNHDGLGEVFIHQVIETIEFVLGCISNTASYLRLWALSLAHSQLGEVFLNLIFTIASMFSPWEKFSGLGSQIPFLFIMGFPYMLAVVLVLLMMDALEVFLHTMRLHWVEFMGKFYQGTGINYKPFSFKEVFAAEAKRIDQK